MIEEKNNKPIETIMDNANGHKHIPLWKNRSFRYIAVLMAVFSLFYYMDVIINYAGWTNLRWGIFYTVHDLHRALFLIPVMYATYEFRLKGILVTSFFSLLVFLPRALVVSPYPDPVLRALIFMVSMVTMGVLLSKLLNNISERKKLEQGLSKAQNDLLRVHAHESLRESEHKYKSLIDNVPDIIFTIDLEGKITFVSKRTQEILGYENAETINMNIFNFIPEEDRQRALENLQKGMKGEKIKHFEIPLIAKSGERLFFECSFSRIYKDGTVIGAQGTAVDITERKRAEKEIQLKGMLLDMAAESILVTDFSGRIVYANKASEELRGYAGGELIGCDLHKLTTPEYTQLLNGRLLEIKQKGELIYESAHYRHDGSSFPIEIHAHMIEIDGGNLVLRIGRDITERKRVETDTALNSHRIQALLQLNQMTDLTLQEITDFALEESVRLTQSKIGYLAFLNEDESVLTMHSWSKSAMAECAISDKPIIYPVATTGLWGEAVRQRRAVFTNDYAADNPLKKGYPQGHVAVTRHMNIPVFVGARIVLVAGVGNKEEDYDQSDVEQLSLLMEGMWRMIERKRAVEEIKKLNEELEQRVAQRTTELSAKTVELERINKVFVDRELKMREMKERLAELEKQKT